MKWELFMTETGFNWQLTRLGSLPDYKKKLLIRINSRSGFNDIVSGFYWYDEKDGNNKFVLDCGGIYPEIDCPLWCYVVYPSTQKLKEANIKQ